MTTTRIPTSNTFARRLRQARLRASLSLRKLEEILNGRIRFTTLANYEAGRHKPDEANLVILAKALHVSPGWFFRPHALELDHFFFRRHRAFGAKDENSLTARAANFFELYFTLEDVTHTVCRFARDSFPKIKVRDESDAERYAERLRELWNLGTDRLPPLVDLLEEKGVKVFQTAVNARIDGMQARTPLGPVVVLNQMPDGRIVSVPRERLTAIHELIHAALEVHEQRSRAEKENERLVWRVSAAFLLPADPFRAAFGQKRKKIALDELVQIKLRFGASIMAIMHRANVLRLINESSYVRFCRYVNSEGWKIKGEPADENFVRRPANARFLSLVRRAQSEQLASPGLIEEMLSAVGDQLQPQHVF